MKFKVLILLCLIPIMVFAEASQNSKLNVQRADIESYVSANKAKVKSGELPASKFYKELYKKFSKSNIEDKAYQMQSLSSAIDKAKQYESGKITKEEFELFKLKLREDSTAHDNDMKLKQR